MRETVTICRGICFKHISEQAERNPTKGTFEASYFLITWFLALCTSAALLHAYRNSKTDILALTCKG